MPTLPKTGETNPKAKTAPEVLNAIRNSASPAFQAATPRVGDNIQDLRDFGKALMDYQPLMNEFVNAINRIGLVLITNKMYANPLSAFKRGLLEFGETVEELFVNIAKGFKYNVEISETNQYKRELPDVRSAFHTLNYKTFYKVTVQNEDIRLAFLGWDGVTDLIVKVVDSLYSAAAYDEQNVTLYMLALSLIRGELGTANITAADTKGGVLTVKELSNSLTFMSTKYNEAGVYNFTNKEDQYILINPSYDAAIDVDVLAAAFNISKVEFMGRRVMMPYFSDLDLGRIQKLLGNEYVEISREQLMELNSVPIIVLSRDWPMIFDNLFKMTEKYNGEGLYWNYWLHVWKIFSKSPFANAIAIVEGSSTITSVTVSPGTATLAQGARLQITPVVAATGFANQRVTYTSDNDNVTVNEEGRVKVGENATGTAVITVTSVIDPTKSGTCTITIQ